MKNFCIYTCCVLLYCFNCNFPEENLTKYIGKKNLSVHLFIKNLFVVGSIKKIKEHINKYNFSILFSLENSKYGEGAVYGSVVSYKCSEGYKLSKRSNSVRTCQADGTWSGK